MSNREQKRQFDEAVRRIEHELGRKLEKAERRRLHDEITGHRYGIDEIVSTGLAMFPR